MIEKLLISCGGKSKHTPCISFFFWHVTFIQAVYKNKGDVIEQKKNYEK